MASKTSGNGRHTDSTTTREDLIQKLNEDLSREYQAVIAYVVYSQKIKGAAYVAIAKELENHAKQELNHALIIAKQIDYLGGDPTVVAKEVKTSDDAREMLQFDLDNENDTVGHYRERIRQCEALGEYATAEAIRKILVDEQDHQIDLATALGVEVRPEGLPPKIAGGEKTENDKPTPADRPLAKAK